MAVSLHPPDTLARKDEISLVRAANSPDFIDLGATTPERGVHLHPGISAHIEANGVALEIVTVEPILDLARGEVETCERIPAKSHRVRAPQRAKPHGSRSVADRSHRTVDFRQQPPGRIQAPDGTESLPSVTQDHTVSRNCERDWDVGSWQVRISRW